MTRDERSRNTVDVTKWDEQDYQKIRAEIAEVPRATDALEEITHTARPEMADVFQLFKKALPRIRPEEEIRDDHLVNLSVNGHLSDLSQFTELRRFTKGNIVAAAMALTQIEPELEVLFDRESVRQKEADELQKLRDKLEDLLNQLAQQMSDQGSGEGQEGSGGSEGQEQGQGGSGLQDEVENLKKMIEALEKALKDGLSEDSMSMQAALAGALEGATEEARGEAMVGRSWGISPGTLKRLPAKERLALAAKMNNPRFREIAELFGPLRNLAFAVREKTVPDIPHEVVGVSLGDDLSHLLPSELARMDDELQEWQFLVDYAEKRLMQYRFRGKEKVAKGGIVLLEDGSSSMQGMRELNAKAVMLVLLDIAKADDREFHLVHFGSAGQFKTLSFTKPSDFTVEKIIEAAELFWSSGTDFVTPLNEGMRILREEHAATGRVESDLIMLTDGFCGLSDEFLEQFALDLADIEGTCYAINLGPDTSSEPVNTLASGKVYSLADLSKGGKELRNMFRSI